jgi:hypothetical protein
MIPYNKKRNATMYILDHRSLKLYPLGYVVNLLGNGEDRLLKFVLSLLTIWGKIVCQYVLFPLTVWEDLLSMFLFPLPIQSSCIAHLI